MMNQDKVVTFLLLDQPAESAIGVAAEVMKAVANVRTSATIRVVHEQDWTEMKITYDHLQDKPTINNQGIAPMNHAPPPQPSAPPRSGLPTAEVSRSPAKPEETSRECVVCRDKPTNAVIKCNHCCMCVSCANRLAKCPLCRAPYTRRNIRQVMFS